MSGRIEGYILATLAKDGPSHGYAIIKSLRLINVEVRLTSVYRALKGLEERDSVVQVGPSQIVEGNRPPRRPFQITVAGKVHLQKLIADASAEIRDLNLFVEFAQEQPVARKSAKSNSVSVLEKQLERAKKELIDRREVLRGKDREIRDQRLKLELSRQVLRSFLDPSTAKGLIAENADRPIKAVLKMPWNSNR